MERLLYNFQRWKLLIVIGIFDNLTNNGNLIMEFPMLNHNINIVSQTYNGSGTIEVSNPDNITVTLPQI